MRLEDMRGRRYGRYEILDLLGRGGMAAVYRARDTMLRRDVALKLLYPQYSGDSMLVERFEREAVLAAQLDHSSIVPIYDVGESNGVVYIAMKLLQGRSLAELLGMQAAIDPQELLPIVDQIASALDYAHARGIVHRDIKPANIILEERSADGPAATTAVLTDFGIAKSLDSPSMTGTGVLIGTPDYMAPEQIRGDRAIDGRADIYALGALVFRALTGKRPFEGSTQEVLIGHLEGKLPLASSVNPALPNAVDEVIGRAMALRPADRFERASAFAQALRAAINAPPGAKPPALHAAPTVPVTLPRAATAEQAQAATAAATAPGAIAALHQSQRVAASPEQPGRAMPEPRRRQFPLMALVIAGLLALLGIGLLIGRLSAGGLAPVPTATAMAAVATDVGPSETPMPSPSATTAATSTPQPSSTPAPSPTAQPSPTTAPTMTASVAPTKPAPTWVPTATRPPTAVPPTVPATATLAPSPTATATLVPSATPSPTLTETPTATPCPISSRGGFAVLREQNERVRTRLGCPAQPIQEGTNTAAEQSFQRGSMLFFDPRKAIWVFVGSDTGAWYRFDESTLQDKPTPTPAPAPGEGLYVPVRGFGLVWAYNPEIREQLGFGTEPEAGPFDGAFQSFTGGTMLYSARGLGNGQTIYVLYSDGTFERYGDPNQ